MSQSAKRTSPQEGRNADSPPPARRGWAKPAADDALDHAAAALARAGFADSALVLRWAAIAGAEIANIAQPVKLSNSADGATLTLKCEAGAMVFLQHQTRALTGRLNSYLGANKIVRIRFVAGRLYDLSEPLSHPALRRGQHAQATPEAKHDLSLALQRLGSLRERVRK